MQGAITSKHIFLHPVAIVRLFGPRFYVRCIMAVASGRPCTFLGILSQC
jgi:hypothetical protein